jgi:ComF family protein
VLEAALDVLFPRRCAGCRDGPWPFCARCAAALVALEPPWCERCGLPAERPVERCPGCPPASIASARAPFLYEGPAREAVLRLKFSGWRTVAAALAAAMAAAAPRRVDVVTWVPLARGRLAERGYDQALALARPLARRLGTPCRALLRRTVETPPQARRGARERRDALAGAFVAVRSPPARVLLVDDVLTTGATAGACAGALPRAGAREVHLLTAARAFTGPGAADILAAGSRPGLWLPGDDPR